MVCENEMKNYVTGKKLFSIAIKTWNFDVRQKRKLEIMRTGDRMSNKLMEAAISSAPYAITIIVDCREI